MLINPSTLTSLAGLAGWKLLGSTGLATSHAGSIILYPWFPKLVTGSADLGVAGSDLTSSRCTDLHYPTGSHVAGPAGSFLPGSTSLDCRG